MNEDIKTPGEKVLLVPPQRIAVYLTPYEWHHMLSELEQAMRVCNRDTKNAKFLYSLIGEQLAGHSVINLEEQKPEETPATEPVKETKVIQTPWYKKIFNDS